MKQIFGGLIQTLPRIFLTGFIALGGVWLVNRLGNSFVRVPAWMQAGEQNSASSPTLPVSGLQ